MPFMLARLRPVLGRLTAAKLSSSKLVVVGLVAMTVLATAGFLVGRGESALHLDIKPGDAWLPTNSDGSVNLVDGLAGKSSAALLLKGASGHRLAVIQVGGKVLVLDETTGLLVRINPVELLLGASLSLRQGSVVVAGLAATYVLNYGAKTVQRIDPVTLRPLGPAVTLDWPPAGTAIVDKSGTLWVPVPAIGSVVPVTGTGAGKPVKVGADGANVVMTSANGVPIAVDRTARKLTVIGPAGAQDVLTLPASVGAGGPLLVPASASPASLPLVSNSGAPSLVIVNLTQGTTTSAPLGAEIAGHHLGAPVQAGPHVFIPDYTTGSVLDYDVSSGTFDPAIPVLGHEGQFEAEVIDGIAYFNDPDGNRAVVVTPDGAVHVVTKNGPHVPTTRTVIPPQPTPTPGPVSTTQPGPVPSPTPTRSRPARHRKPHHHKPARTPTPRPTPSKTRTPTPTPTPSPTPTPTKSSPAPPPLAPVDPVATAGDGVVNVTWQPPASGGPVTSYQVTVTPSGGSQQSTGATSVQFTGLTCGTTYSFQVSSIGADGQPVAATPVSAMSCVPPGAPQNLTTSISANEISVNWAAPGSDGGGTVTYTVSWGSGSHAGLTGDSDTITGLPNFATYTVTVTAGNQAGTGGSMSASVDLTAGPWGGYNITRNSIDPLHVRAGPSTGSASLGTFPPGSSAPVTIICQTAGGGYSDPSGSPAGDIWDEFDYNGTAAFVADGYVTTPNSLANAFSPPIWQC